MAPSQKFRLYSSGDLQFRDQRVTSPVCFAHVTDLHHPGIPRNEWPVKYRKAIEWWNIEMRQPDRSVSLLLDRIKESAVDFVFFGGDTLDYYNAPAAQRIVQLCRERGLRAWFQLGNHDWESEDQRFVTHQYDEGVCGSNGRELRGQWKMPGLYYSFELGAVRFVVLNFLYLRKNGCLEGHADDDQSRWLFDQLAFDGPIVIFHHIPFALPTNQRRIRAIWRGPLACVAEDANGKQVREAIANCPNVLGTFTGHTHLSGEDPLGQTWQFMTQAACLGGWRFVKIHNVELPKSLVVPGNPTVDGS